MMESCSIQYWAQPGPTACSCSTGALLTLAQLSPLPLVT